MSEHEQKKEESSESGLKRLLSIGADATGTTLGTIVGAMLGGMPGAAAGAAGGAMATGALKWVGEEVSKRFLSPREEQRVGSVIVLAQVKIDEKIKAGEKLRSDGFFSATEGNERSKADEIMEGVLVAAQRDHEEKKTPYYANLLANIAFAPHVTKDDANFLLTLGESLKYRDLCLLRVAAIAPHLNLRTTDYRNSIAQIDQPRAFLLTQIFRLYGDALIHFSGAAALGITDVVPAKMVIQGSGVELYNLMELWGIPQSDIDPIIALLR